jgi:hypothetical protein
MTKREVIAKTQHNRRRELLRSFFPWSDISVNTDKSTKVFIKEILRNSDSHEKEQRTF